MLLEIRTIIIWLIIASFIIVIFSVLYLYLYWKRLKAEVALKEAKNEQVDFPFEKKFLKVKSLRIAMIAMFSVISIVLDSIITPGFSAGVWFGWIFIMSPVNGLVLGPIDGFITTLLSVMIGHTIVFRESIYEYIFSLGAPVASLIAGLIYRQRKSLVMLYYIILVTGLSNVSYVYSGTV